MATRIVAHWTHCPTEVNVRARAMAAALPVRPMLRRGDRPTSVSGSASKTSNDPAPNISRSPRRNPITMPPLPLYGFGSRH